MNYYNILQVDENASQEKIKQAYYKMARLFHPDNFNGSQKDAEEQMAKINEAYSVLRDEKKRAIYDESRKANTKAQSSTENRTPKKENEFQREAEYRKPVHEMEYTKRESSNSFSEFVAKVVGGIIAISIFWGILDSLGVIEKVEQIFSSNTVQQLYDNEADLVGLEPDKVVDSYFTYIRKGNDKSANKLFTEDCDFQTMTVAEFNETVTGIYYSFEKDIPMYPLFEEVRNFNYQISDVKIDEMQEYADVSIQVENCDVALIFGGLLEMNDGSDYLASLSDREAQEVFRTLIKEYKETCMISTNVTVTLKNLEGQGWKIQNISPLKDFSIVMVGQATDLILALNGEDIDDYYEENEDMDDYYEDDEDIYDYYEEDDDIYEDFDDETDLLDEYILPYSDSINKSYQRIKGRDVITNPKTEGSKRVVTLPDFLVSELREYVGHLYGLMATDRIFPVTKSSLTYELRRGAELAGVKVIRLHDLRHSHASLLISKLKMQPNVVAQRLGHDNIKTTLNTYSHLYPNEMRNLADQLDSINKNTNAKEGKIT